MLFQRYCDEDCTISRRDACQHEITQKSDADFARRIRIKAEILASRGHQLVRDGYITEATRAQAEAEARAWAKNIALSQGLYLLAVEGNK